MSSVSQVGREGKKVVSSEPCNPSRCDSIPATRWSQAIYSKPRCRVPTEHPARIGNCFAFGRAGADDTWEQACRTSKTDDGPGVRLGCNADATGESWDTWNGAKVGVAALEPSWENPSHSAMGSTWGMPAAGTGYY